MWHFLCCSVSLFVLIFVVTLLSLLMCLSVFYLVLATVSTNHLLTYLLFFSLFVLIWLTYFKRENCAFVEEKRLVYVWVFVRFSPMGVADDQYRRCTRNVRWCPLWNYRIHWRLLRMREASRCSAASNTCHKQRSVYRFWRCFDNYLMENGIIIII